VSTWVHGKISEVSFLSPNTPSRSSVPCPMWYLADSLIWAISGLILSIFNSLQGHPVILASDQYEKYFILFPLELLLVPLNHVPFLPHAPNRPQSINLKRLMIDERSCIWLLGNGLNAMPEKAAQEICIKPWFPKRKFITLSKPFSSLQYSLSRRATSGSKN